MSGVVRRVKVKCKRCGRKIGGMPMPAVIPQSWSDPVPGELECHDWMVSDGVMRGSFYGPQLEVDNVDAFHFEVRGTCRQCGPRPVIRLHQLVSSINGNEVTL